jgi:predicted negative regulator of RcsB-dependent stress response
MIKPKYLCIIFLIINFLAILGYIYFSHRNGPRINSTQITSQHITSSIQEATIAHSASQQALQHISSLPKIHDSITTNTYMNSEKLEQIKITENSYLDAISKLKIETEKQQIVISNQGKYIIVLKHQVIKWKVISAILTGILIKVTLF